MARCLGQKVICLLCQVQFIEPFALNQDFSPDGLLNLLELPRIIERFPGSLDGDLRNVLQRLLSCEVKDAD